MSDTPERGEAFLPAPEIEAVGAALIGRVRAAARGLRAGNFAHWLDATALVVPGLAFGRIGASEGSIWLVDEARTHLEVAWNSGPKAAEVTGFRQPLGEGIVSMVFMTEQSFCENRVYQNQRQSRTLDRQLGLLTCSMVVVPFRIAGQLRGVISAVKLKPDRQDAADPAGFLPEDVATVEVASGALGRLVEWQVMAELGSWKHGM